MMFSPYWRKYQLKEERNKLEKHKQTCAKNRKKRKNKKR